MNEQTFTPEELEELARQDLECNEQPNLTEGILSTLSPQKTAKEGSKSNPTKIKVAQAFFVECPRCDEMIDTGSDNEKLECPECGRKFYIEFDRFDCGL